VFGHWQPRRRPGILIFFLPLLIARALSVTEFGIFSAAANLIVIISSVTDIGLSSGLVNFVASFWAKKEEDKANQYIKAAFLMKFLTVSVLSAIILILAPFVSKTLLATGDTRVAFWVVVISLALFSWTFFPFVLQAQNFFGIDKSGNCLFAVSTWRPDDLGSIWRFCR